MSGFSADWLALREPADAAARAERLTHVLSHAVIAHATLRILDLGGGTGSNIRFLAPRLTKPQQWTLVDHDDALLAQVPARMTAWAGANGYGAQSHAGGVLVGVDGRACEVSMQRADLRTAVDDPALYANHALVTASALLDLVSRAWVETLARRCREAGASVLLALNYDGRIICTPENPDDVLIRDLVNQHQRTDKGFGGPALGPAAADVAEDCFSRAGYVVERAASDWVLEPGSESLQVPLIDGWADAAAEIAPEHAERIQAWRARRLAHVAEGRSVLIVGHEDVVGRLA